jgi:succinate dehydrogenase/fumarate reductase flavoprotein subunit
MAERTDERGVTRRGFLRGTVAGTGAAVLGGTGGRPAEAAAPPPSTWDRTADVVVVGYGGAGAVSAVTAHDRGAKVLVLEKQPADRHTSNTQMCLGVFLSPDTVENAVAYMSVASRVNVDMPESKDIDDDVIRAWAETSVQNKAWLAEMGAREFVTFANQGRDPRWPGNAGIKAYQLKRADGSPGVGVDLFGFLDGLVTQRKIEILWDAPATRLVAGPGGDVTGVRATYQGREIAVRATRAVILTCGGYEFDEKALRTYLPAYPMTFYGNPGNTGDGIRMAQELGADLWHMTVLGGGLKIKFPDFPTAFGEAFGTGSFVVVDRAGRRFKAETQLGGYSGYWNALVYDTVNYTWPRIPAYYVFDEKRRLAGPIIRTNLGAAGPVGMYRWSPDNSAEVARGWIVKADTVEALAARLGMEPGVLRAEVDRFNGARALGKDEAFGRPVGSIAPLDTPPFYAVPLWPGLNNTFGGPRRNARAQVVDVFGQPIPRLYSAGELGSIFVQYPQGGANVGECIAFGRIAGANAAAEAPARA